MNFALLGNEPNVVKMHHSKVKYKMRQNRELWSENSLIYCQFENYCHFTLATNMRSNFSATVNRCITHCDYNNNATELLNSLLFLF